MENSLKLETSLCKRFTKFVLKYELMTSDILIVPINEESSSNNVVSSASVNLDYSNTILEGNSTVLEETADTVKENIKESNESDA